MIVFFLVLQGYILFKATRTSPLQTHDRIQLGSTWSESDLSIIELVTKQEESSDRQEANLMAVSAQRNSLVRHYKKPPAEIFWLSIGKYLDS